MITYGENIYITPMAEKSRYYENLCLRIRGSSRICLGDVVDITEFELVGGAAMASDSSSFTSCDDHFD